MSARSLAPAASLGAWLFALGSLGALGWIIANHGSGADETSTLLGSGDRSGLGFRYEGAAGTFLAMAQALGVLVALVLSVLPHTTLRRAGHLGLVAWCGLWLLNALYLAPTGPRGFWLGVAGVLAVFLACTVHRALAAWPPRRDLAGSAGP